MSDNFLIPTPDQLKEDNAKLRKRIDELLEEKLIEVDREQKLWELYVKCSPMSPAEALDTAYRYLEWFEEKAPGILASACASEDAKLKEGE